MSEMTTMNDDNSFFVQPVDTTAGYLLEGWGAPDGPYESLEAAVANVADQCGRPIEQFHWEEEVPGYSVRIWMYPEFWPTGDGDV